jgi:hypothetical protein
MSGAVGADGSQAPPKIELPRTGFEFVTRARGVWVYKNTTADLIWIGAVGIIPAQPDQILSALLDYEHQPGKIGRVSEAKILSRGADSLYVYERLNLPVISDRDFTLKVTHGTDGRRTWVTYAAVSDRGPGPRDGIVRVTRQFGIWELIPTDDGTGTFVRSEFRIDLAGSVPLWLVNSGAGKEIPALYADVCKLSLGPGGASKCP